MHFLKKLIATFFGAGYSPFASGTVGSAFACVLFWFLPSDSVYFAVGTILLLPVGAYFCSVGQEFWHKTDSGKIVLDEAFGQAVTLFFMPHRWEIFLLAFFLFRLFDITKPPPARQAESIPGGWGVLLDDIAAGIYANAVLWALRFSLLKG